MTTKEKKGTGFFLAILTIVTVVCIIVGCILHLGFGFSRSGSGKMKSDEVAAERFKSISLELVSRGCEQVVSVEADRDHHAFIKQCLKKLGTDRCIAIRGDVFRFVKSCRQQFDLIFADPPYALPELPLIPDLIMGTKPSAEDGPSASAQQSSLFTPHSPLLKPGGIFVFEHGKHNDFTQHPCFLEHRSYGSVNFSLFREAVPTSEQPIPTNV